MRLEQRTIMTPEAQTDTVSHCRKASAKLWKSETGTEWNSIVTTVRQYSRLTAAQKANSGIGLSVIRFIIGGRIEISRQNYKKIGAG